jgi:hypothetical protein
MTANRVVWGMCLAVGLTAASITGGAQQTPPAAGPAAPAPPASDDPRVGLKPGLTDPGVAARHMELVLNIPRPEGFNDPAGRGGLGFANSDLAFKGGHAFLGNFFGFNFFDIEDPRKARVRLSMPCPGGQGDLSVVGHLMFMSVEEGRGRIDCGTQGVTGPVSAERFRGVRVFDISDINKPRQVAAVQTCRGSHTHTVVRDLKDKSNLYIYGSGTGGPRSPDELAGCSSKTPTDDPNTSLYSIDVIQVPLAAPERARVVNRPRIFADLNTGAIAGLWPGGAHGEGTQRSSSTNQCHDITAYPEVGLAAGACSGNGILLDISDPFSPKRLDAVTDPSFAYWHSASFNNDGTKVIFTDEWGGGTSPRCRATDKLTWGADAIFDIVDGKLKFASYYKMPAPQTDQENCVAHNGSLVPVPGRDIKVQAWYQGGLSIFDFTDSSKPVEIAFFDRGPVDEKQMKIAGFWSTYWYNGYIYGSEIMRGLDIFRLLPSEFLSKNEIDAANLVKFDELNVQSQPKVTWPANLVVARAYIDQLTRTKGIQAARAAAVTAAMEKVERTQPGRANATALAQLNTLAGDLESDAGSAAPQDAARLRALAGVLRARAVALK